MARTFILVACILVALFQMTGCDLHAPPETVIGMVVDAVTEAPIPDALVEVGYTKPSWCEILTGKPCGLTPFILEGSGMTGADGAFSVSYDSGPARLIRVRPCPEVVTPGECPYYGASMRLPSSGEIDIRLTRRE